jgi:segregation and condensation protein A
MTTSEYRVSLDIFGGPMDLLLYLVRRNEVDILDLPLAKITLQFLEFLDVLRLLDVDLAADFVATASTLVEIKSRIVLPRQEEPESEQPLDEEPPSDLVHKLMEYKKLRDAALALEEHAALWQERFPRLSDERPSQERDLGGDRIKEVELWDLVSALARVLRRSVVEQETNVRETEIPLAVHMEAIGQRVRREGRVAFSTFFDGESKRNIIVGLFLAILELLRHHGFRAEQTADYGEIWIRPPINDAGGPLVPSASEEPPTPLPDEHG